MIKFEITNPQRIVYKKDKITKLDIIDYYNQIASYMFPYLDRRLLSVIRCHTDTSQDLFFKKHPTIKSPFIQNYNVEANQYFYLKSTEGIILEAQLGTIEFHTWASSTKSISKPDIMTFDLDPDEEIDLRTLRQGVRDLKEILDKLNIKSFLKTSGGKGYHIVVPFMPSCRWNKFYDFSRRIAEAMQAYWPKKYTTNVRKIERKNKIFIDYMRNNKGSTCVAPFSLRARRSPTVSMPIDWKDLDKIAPNDFTIKNSLKTIKKSNPWKDFFHVSQKII